MATIASLLVVMGMDTTGLKAGSAQATGSLAKVGASAKSSLGSVVPLAAAAAGAALIKVGIDAVNAASDLEESVNKVKVVFEGSAERILEWGKTTASAMGISEQAALEAAGTFGNLFDAMGLADNAGAKMSTTLVGLAADLASFNNADPTDVLQALQSGLTGQIRPLRQFGIEISEAAIAQEALAQGIKKNTSEMTLAEKVQLRYALILKQTGNAQGDFERTSGGLANQQRILAATWEDLQATLGKLLLPAVTGLVHALGDLGHVLLFVTGQTKDFDQATQDALVNVGKFELKIGDFFTKFAGNLPIVGDFIDAWDGVKAAQDAAAGGVKLTGYQLDVLNTAIASGDPNLVAYRDHWMEIADNFLGFTPRLDAVKGRVETVTTAFQAFFGVVPKVQEATHAVQRFGNLAPKALEDFRQGLVESVQVAIGQFEHLKDAFSTTPKELARQAHLAVQIAKTMHQDLKAIMGSKDLTDAQKQALASLPADQRHAFAEAGEGARRQITRDAVSLARLNGQSMKGVIDAAAKQAHSGGQSIGHTLTTSIGAGMQSGSGSLNAIAIAVVTAAIAAAKRAAGIASPSKKMIKLGVDLMLGLQKGITDTEQKVIDAAQKAIDHAIKQVENDLSRVEKALDKVKSAADEFKSSITGGFGSFLDLSGGFAIPATPEELTPEQIAAQAAAVPTTESALAFLNQQLAGAKQFAAVLKALEQAGASKEFLASIASAGPEALPFAQALLQGGPAAVGQASAAFDAINKLAEKTAKNLSEVFFGKEMHRLQDKVDRLHEDLKALQHPRSGGAVWDAMHGGHGGNGGGAPGPHATFDGGLGGKVDPPVIVIEGNMADWFAWTDEGLAGRRRIHGRLALDKKA